MKFSVSWLGEFVDVQAAGGLDGVRRLLEQAGLPVESVEGKDRDAVLDVEITPNRPDAMSHRGLAREIAAMAGIGWRSGGRSAPLPAGDGPPVTDLALVEIAVPMLCRRFGARVVEGISGAPASDAVRARLTAIGAKSISAAVDATNYALWEIGQPLHAFDLDRLAQRRIVVRKARRGERLVTLDGVERKLEPSDVVVADAERAVSLAGIMGGLDTAVHEGTRNVLLEAAWWDPGAIRRTARRLGMHTDASHRFERGADPEAIPEGLDLAARLLRDSAGGRLAREIIDARGKPFRQRSVKLTLARLRLVAGDDRLDLAFAAEALERLGFQVERRPKRLAVRVPSFRHDVAIEDDLVEEVLRVYGYDRLPTRVPPATGGGAQLEPLREVEDRLSDRAVAAGLCETFSYPFVDHEAEEGGFAAWIEASGAGAPPLALANPLDESRKALRQTLLPGLLDALSRNVRHGAASAALFESARGFGRKGEPERPESFEDRRFAFALTGQARAHWSVPANSREFDFFDAKGLFEGIVSPWAPPETIRWSAFADAGFAAGATALARTGGGEVLGVVGLLGASETESRRLTGDVFAGEVLVASLPRRESRARFAPYSIYPPVAADISFSHPREADWERIARFVEGLAIANLERLEIVDRYVGSGVPEGRVKTTLRLTFRAADRTLEQDEVNRERDRLAAALEQELGASF